MSGDLRLGSFRLHHRIGSGGMGDVWRAEHGPTGEPAAVKVISAAHAGRPAAAAAFLDEVRAVARLDHPGIVRVHDAGAVTADAAAASGGALVAGSPWLAMELVPRGSLADSPPLADWPTLRTGLVGILDALAHAHARGVVHRDLKPANVLLGEPGPAGSLALRLTDFGLAWAMGSELRAAAAGTPAYMAPEQFRGDWREIGPWTDLYALGCAAWELVCGAAPFQGDTAALARAHTSAALPTLEPRFPVPVGFGRWLAGLLARRPADRVRRAADAARQLLALEDARRSGPVSLSGVSATTLAACLEGATPTWDEEPEVDDLPTEEVALPVPPPPFPRSWSLPGRPRAGIAGVGLGLHGLREPPLVARAVERDALWAVARVACATDRPRVVRLHGPRGVGKTRLADWLLHRLAELGLADVLTLEPGPLGLALERWLSLGGLDAGARRARAERALADLGGGIAAQEILGAAIERGRPADVAGALRALLTLRARGRPQVLWIREGALAVEALAFAAGLLAERLPLLVGFEVDTDGVVDGADLGEKLRSAPGAVDLAIRPLAVDELAALGRELGLQPPLAEAVATRADGSAVFVAQLVGDWVARGALVGGSDGFRLAGGAAELPRDLGAVWAERLASVGAGGLRALEVAAVLGPSVEPAVWEAALRAARVPLPPDLVESALAGGLLRRGDGLLAFAHPLLRERVLEGLGEETLGALRALCAEALTAEAPTLARRVAALKLDRDRDPEAALSLALRLHRDADLHGDGLVAAEALALAERALDRARLPDADPRRVKLANAQATHELTRGRGTAAHARATQAEFLAERSGDHGGQVEAVRVQAVAAVMLGRLAIADAAAEHGLFLARTHGVPDAVPRLLATRGDVARMSGRLQEAVARYAEALRAEDIQGVCRVDCWNGMAASLFQMGELDEAAACYDEAERCTETLSVRAAVVSGRGEIARKRGRLDEAARHYAWAIERLALFGIDRPIVPTMNLALVRLAQGDPAGAAALVEPLQVRLEASGRRALAAACSALLTPAAAASGDLAAFSRHLEAVVAARARGFVDADVGESLERAGDAWSASGCPGPARAAWTEALEHVRSNPAATARLQGRLAT